MDAAMGIELRKGRYYWYDRKRVNGRVRCDYFGAVPSQAVALFRMQAEVDFEKRVLARHKIEQLAKWADAILATGEEFNREAEGVFRDVMQSTGHTLHKRSEWRRTRGAIAMAEPEGSVVAVKNSNWIGVAERAAASLLLMASQDDDAVSKGMAKYWDTIDKLLADGPTPTFAERMAATRCAHNWLAVHILECKAALQPPTGPNALMLDKRVTLAEKRLHASLKSLAVLRRLRKPAVVKQVNIAKGPMVVNNGYLEK